MVERGAAPAGGESPRAVRGLRALGRARKRLRDASADVVVGAQMAAAEEGRRKTARMGGRLSYSTSVAELKPRLLGRVCNSWLAGAGSGVAGGCR